MLYLPAGQGQQVLGCLNSNSKPTDGMPCIYQPAGQVLQPLRPIPSPDPTESPAGHRSQSGRKLPSSTLLRVVYLPEGQARQPPGTHTLPLSPSTHGGWCLPAGQCFVNSEVSPTARCTFCNSCSRFSIHGIGKVRAANTKTSMHPHPSRHCLEYLTG